MLEHDKARACILVVDDEPFSLDIVSESLGETYEVHAFRITSYNVCYTKLLRKLWAGTVEVYGEADAVARYGRIIPVDADRIIEATEGRVIDLAGRAIRIAETPGHAMHHVCYFDEKTRAWFTGDTFGLRNNFV